MLLLKPSESGAKSASRFLGRTDEKNCGSLTCKPNLSGPFRVNYSHMGTVQVRLAWIAHHLPFIVEDHGGVVC